MPDMTPRSLALLLISILSSLTLTAQEAAAQIAAPTLIQSAAYFDGERFQPPADILIEHGVIMRIGAELEAPDGAVVIDAEGAVLIPGLIDAHAHIINRASLEDGLRYGVTTVLDMSTNPGIVAQLRAALESDQSSRISDFRSAGNPATVPGGMGTRQGMMYRTVLSEHEVKPFIEECVEEGSDYIKIVCEDGAAYGVTLSTLSEPVLALLIEEAHAQGKLAIVHATTKQWTERAIRAGADVISHVFHDQRIDQDLIDLARDSDVVFISALTLAERRAGPVLTRDTRLAPFLAERQRATLNRGVRAPLPDGAVANANHNIRALHDAGVTILAGTDAPNPGTAHGVSLHRELQLLVNAGFDTEAALRAATSSTADVFGLNDRARIAEGARADLILLEADPRDSILNTRDIREIWKQGAPVDRAATLESE